MAVGPRRLAVGPRMKYVRNPTLKCREGVWSRISSLSGTGTDGKYAPHRRSRVLTVCFGGIRDCMYAGVS